MAESPRLQSINLDQRLTSKKVYQALLSQLQNDMAHLEKVCFHNHARVVVLFEGWDASGKGGAIRRLTQAMDPRGYRVYPIGKPTEAEASCHYLQRFWSKIPPKGNIAIFDRSWYGRVLVERIEGFATQGEWQRAFMEINAFEKTLTDDGILLFKFFMHVSPEEQLKRFKERLENPEKNWKITAEDIRNREQWRSYESAYEDMFRATDTTVAPWHLIAGEHKWFARTRVLKIITDELKAKLGWEIPRLSKAEISRAKAALSLD